MPRIPVVLTSGTLPPAELAAARLDGELFAVDESWVCADEPDRFELRTTALAALLPPSASTSRLIMMGLTAAWLHGATDAPPFCHEVCVRLQERAALRLPRRFLLRELAMKDADECRMGCIRVTTPVRTVFDLARRDRPGAAERFAIDALMLMFGIRPDDVASGIRLPGRRAAVERIAAIHVEQGR
ncbi:type IV toxin-antitoxin system AbiEi family antitoxin [Mycetocola sp. 2940]|uniref:type IV toxin-antitoxin system AbiEi family antitoxin n=1 Tax=Mycetocola sp. 2940 TaxID=3156452 RepID=UPI003396DFBD